MSTEIGRTAADRTHQPRRGSRRGLEVKPGAILQARTEAGLSLAEVAAGEVSRVAIHRIERGLSRPTLRTLELIAARTGRPVAWFLEAPQTIAAAPEELLELERAVTEERFEQAEAMGRALLAVTHDRTSIARIQLLVGEARVWLGRADQALDLLAAARREFERGEDPLREVAAMDWEAMALCLLQRPEALGLAQRALAACRGLDVVPVPLEVRILSHIGSAHVLRREWDEAVRIYEQAIEAAGSVRDLRRLGLMYANLAIAYGSAGQPERGIGFAHRALALHQLHRDRLSLARTRNNLAMIQLQLGRLQEAEASALQALAGFAELGVERERTNILLTLAEIKLAQGKWRECAARLDEVEALASELQEDLPLATAHELRARLMEARDNSEGSDREYRIALDLLERAGSSERWVECAVNHARSLRRRGELAAGYELLERALRLGRPHLAEQSYGVRYLTG